MFWMGFFMHPDRTRVIEFFGRCQYRRVRLCTGREVRRGDVGSVQRTRTTLVSRVGERMGRVGWDTGRANVSHRAFEAWGGMI